MISTFKKGIHPAGHKELSENSPIRSVEAGAELVYPLSQHIGAPAEAIVEKGDRVLAGQLIARPCGFVSAPIHSAVSGTVKGIEPRTVSSGASLPSIIIENDFKYEWVEDARPIPEKVDLDEETLSGLTKEKIREKIAAAGIVGLGGAGFPVSVKLTPQDDDSIDNLIINGAECEPYLTSDHRLMLERGEELVAGCRILLRLFPRARCVIGIENNKPDAISRLNELCKGVDGISVMPLKAKYPQGGERMLIYAVTKRKLNSKLLPSAVGCIVMNVASVIASYRAVLLSRPLTHRVMTVTGDGVVSPCNLEVPIGILHSEVLEAAGGFSGDVQKVISGGPMMGSAMYSLDTPVVKTSSSILAMKIDPVSLHEVTNCIRCGRCVHSCPENLLPQMLAEAADRGELDRFEKLGGMECIECGSCAYTCPAKRHLVQSIRYGKRETGAILRVRKESEAKK